VVETWAWARTTSSSAARPAWKRAWVSSSVFFCASRFWRDRDLPLQAADLDIVARDFRQQRDQDVAPGLDARLHVRLRRLDAATDAAEDVELPGGVKARLVEVALPARAGQRHVFAAAVPRVACAGVHRRKEGAGRDALEAAGLADPGFGQLEVEIRRRRAINQRGQLVVAERLPPLLHRRRPGGHPAGRRIERRLLFAPLPGQRGIRLLVVGADRAGRQRQQRRGGDPFRVHRSLSYL
jgi:hypothetical protein